MTNESKSKTLKLLKTFESLFAVRRQAGFLLVVEHPRPNRARLQELFAVAAAVSNAAGCHFYKRKFPLSAEAFNLRKGNAQYAGGFLAVDYLGGRVVGCNSICHNVAFHLLLVFRFWPPCLKLGDNITNFANAVNRRTNSKFEPKILISGNAV